ncbi:MAG: hypothetical protein Q7R79_02530 [bacterium]|nr:hypothetical protein [bacterium]
MKKIIFLFIAGMLCVHSFVLMVEVARAENQSDTSTWKTLNTGPVTFQYPSDWTVEEHNKTLFILTSADKNLEANFIQVPKDRSILQFKEEWKLNLERKGYVCPTSEQLISIDDVDAYEFECKRDDASSTAVAFESNDHNFGIVLHPGASDAYLSKIISTIHIDEPHLSGHFVGIFFLFVTAMSVIIFVMTKNPFHAALITTTGTVVNDFYTKATPLEFIASTLFMFGATLLFFIAISFIGKKLRPHL